MNIFLIAGIVLVLCFLFAIPWFHAPYEPPHLEEYLSDQWRPPFER